MNIAVHRDAPREAHLAAERYRIKQQIEAAIKPQLDRADELLDYYTDGLPRELWEPILAQFRPLPAPSFSEIIEVITHQLATLRDGVVYGVAAAFDTLAETLQAASDNAARA